MHSPIPIRISPARDGGFWKFGTTPAGGARAGAFQFRLSIVCAKHRSNIEERTVNKLKHIKYWREPGSLVLHARRWVLVRCSGNSADLLRSHYSSYDIAAGTLSPRAGWKLTADNSDGTYGVPCGCIARDLTSASKRSRQKMNDAHWEAITFSCLRSRIFRDSTSLPFQLVQRSAEIQWRDQGCIQKGFSAISGVILQECWHSYCSWLLSGNPTVRKAVCMRNPLDWVRLHESMPYYINQSYCEIKALVLERLLSYP